MISARVKNFIEKYNLSGPFLVAFSGGYDSMCLLDVLCKLGYDVAAIHLNHNWRGKESLDEAKKCEEFAKLRGIKFYSEILPDFVEKTETAARTARYDFFKRCAEKFNSNVVLTAHNFDDNAETVLYRIIKGTGIAGLQGILENRDIFYRPLLTTTRQEIEAYCRDNGLNPNVDSSNFNTKYMRNFIRYKILPIMKEINPKVVNALNSLSDIAKSGDKNDYIINLLRDYDIEYDREKVENIRNFIEENQNSKSGKTFSLANDLWLFVNNENLKVISKKEKNSLEIKINSEGEYNFEDYIFSIKPYAQKITSYPPDSDFKAFINIKEIDFTLRHRKPGDRIQPLGMLGSQKLKKYLNEKKILQYKKDEIILLCKDNEVLWAAGVGLNDKIKVLQNPTHVITLRRGGYGY